MRYPFTVYVPQVLFDRYQTEVNEEMAKDPGLSREQAEIKVGGRGLKVEPVPFLPAEK